VIGDVASLGQRGLQVWTVLLALHMPSTFDSYTFPPRQSSGPPSPTPVRAQAVEYFTSTAFFVLFFFSSPSTNSMAASTHYWSAGLLPFAMRCLFSRCA